MALPSNLITLEVKPIGSTILSLPREISQGNSFPSYLKGQVEEIEPVGSQLEPNLEKILLLKPDLIIGWEPIKAVYPQLSKIALTVLSSWRGLHPSWQEHLDFVAEVLGKEETLEIAWSQYYKRIEELKVDLGDRYQNKEISVIHIHSNGISSFVRNSFDGTILNDAGLQRSKTQDLDLPNGRIEEISQEELEKIDSDILFVITGDTDSNQRLKALQKKPLWRKLRAVQNNQVYFVPTTTWYAGGGNLLAADAVIDDLYKYLVNAP